MKPDPRFISSFIIHPSSFIMLTGPEVILVLKVAVCTVTLLLLAALIAVARGNYWLHGRINMVFFVLTVTALFGLELVARVIDPTLFDYFDDRTRRILAIHLCFSLPSAAIMPVMLFTGLTHRRRWHLTLAAVFAILWIGTFVTGVFFLPHTR
jgi:uncharacterized membrane protein YozB (DUF420 family)